MCKMIEDRDVLESVIQRALTRLYNNDSYLLEYNLYEQCIAFRFGVYLQEELKHTIYRKYDLDAEYNKNMDCKKWLKSWPDGARPDFVLHKRGNNTPTNILIIELKKGKRPRVTKKDEEKIKEFMKYPYEYCYGATLLLSPNKYELKWVSKE